jgi:histone arginine demethylase JMJD6
LWMGPPDACAGGLHSDRGHNFVVQLVGRKRWAVFPKAQRPLLYFPPNGPVGYFHHSPIILEAPDLQKYPEFRKATPVEFILQPGETLFPPEAGRTCTVA